MPALRDVMLAKSGADKMRRVLVPVPELTDVPIYARGMTAAERDEWDLFRVAQRRAAGEGREDDITAVRNVSAKAVVMCTVDANGDTVFQAEDVEAVGQLEAAPVNRLWAKIAELTGIGEELREKNSATASGSPSDSPSA